MRRTTLFFFCAFASVTIAYPFEDSKALFAFGQDDEILEDTADALKEVKLSFPVNFARQLYGTVFVSTDSYRWEIRESALSFMGKYRFVSIIV